MSGFNPDYTVIRTIDPGISGFSLGNIPSSMQLFNSTITPTDASVTGNEAAPFTTMIEQNTGTHNAAFYYADSFIQNGNIPHRVSAAVRATDDLISPFEATTGGSANVSLVYGSRLNSDSANTKPVLNFGVRHLTTHPGGADISDILLSIQIAGDTFGLLTSYAVSLYNWYRVGIEVLANTINFYIDLNPTDDPSTLPGNGTLELFYTHTLANPKALEGPVVYAGGALSSHYSDSAYGDAITDLLLEELEGPPGRAGKLQPPGGGGGGVLSPTVPVNFPPFSLDFPGIPKEWPYTQWKAVKELQKIYGNLDLNG